jgi:hypothetical protein
VALQLELAQQAQAAHLLSQPVRLALTQPQQVQSVALSH